MSHYELSGSEEGQLKSNGDQSGDDDHGTDSLDIKPPQHHHHRSDAIRRRSGKDKKHSKDRKHKDRHREKHSDTDHKSKSHDKDHRFDKSSIDLDEETMSDRRHKYFDKNSAAASGHLNRKSSSDRKTQRGREYYDREYDYYNRSKIGSNTGGSGGGGSIQRERDKAQISDRHFLQLERRKYESIYDYKQDAETLEQDLRSRLLSKRNKYAKEYQRYDEQSGYKKPQQTQWQQSSHDHRERVDNREREYHENKLREVTFVIDSPEHLDDYRNKKRQKKKDKHRRSDTEKHSHSESNRDRDRHDPSDEFEPELTADAENSLATESEDLDQAARKAKLLDAEREMARRKEVAREELQARREMRRERGESTPEPTKPKKRHFQSDEDENKVHHIKIKKIQNRSAKEDENFIEISEPSDISTEEEGNESSDSQKSKRNSRTNANDVKETRPESSQSVVEIPITPENCRKQSSSRSQSHSPGSHQSRSHSRDSRSVSQSKSHSRSIESDRSLSVRSQSRSASRSQNSRSRSRSRSEERFMKSSKNENEAPDVVEIKETETVEKKVETVDEIKLASPPKENFESLPNYYPGIQGCRSVEEFQCLNRIEEGTYGVVYRAKDKRTNEVVALKRLKMEKEKEGFPITSLREINTLLKGQHPNIVTVREIVVGSNMDKIFIVMDYVEHDLKSLMEIMKNRDQFFFPGEVKCLIQQLLRAVGHLHDNWILHRDLKTTNLLLSHKGILKVGDFGLAREYGSPLKQYTTLVVTLWYRAPELLLCSKEYSTPIDMWSVGCIFAEFLQMETMFYGNSEIDQLNQIFKNLGTPNEKIWPGYKDLPAVQNMLTQNSQFTEYPVSNLKKKFIKKTTEVGVSLLQGLLTYDPKQRLSAEQALRHPYFKELPLPIDPSMFPTWPAKSEVGLNKAMMMSPKPPPGGAQYKQLRGDDNHSTKSNIPSSSGLSSNAARKKSQNSTGFVLNSGIDQRQVAMGPGFNLKF